MIKRNLKKVASKPVTISRKEFIIKSSILGGAIIFLPRIVLGQCDLTTDDILGPYFVEDAPIRTIIAHPDEPWAEVIYFRKDITK